MSIVIVCESHGKAYRLEESAKRQWPGATIDVVILKFQDVIYRYQRGLPMLAYPHVMKNDGALPPLKKLFANEGVETEDSLQRKLDQAEKIVCACDVDHTGAILFDLFAAQYLSRRISQSFLCLNLVSLNEKSLDVAFSQLEDFYVARAPVLRAGKLKRYFDWNWNNNAVVILRAMMTSCGIEASSPVVSKFGLQLLYALRGYSTAGVAFNFLHNNLIERWSGTGKYERSVRLLSPASHMKVIDQLIEVGFVAVVTHKYLDEVAVSYRVSESGEAFLEKIPKDCCDLDLRFRLNEWMLEGAESDEKMDIVFKKMDRYLMTFFGKLKRGLAKINQKEG